MSAKVVAPGSDLDQAGGEAGRHRRLGMASHRGIVLRRIEHHLGRVVREACFVDRQDRKAPDAASWVPPLLADFLGWQAIDARGGTPRTVPSRRRPERIGFVLLCFAGDAGMRDQTARGRIPSKPKMQTAPAAEFSGAGPPSFPRS